MWKNSQFWDNFKAYRFYEYMITQSPSSYIFMETLNRHESFGVLSTWSNSSFWPRVNTWGNCNNTEKLTTQFPDRTQSLHSSKAWKCESGAQSWNQSSVFLVLSQESKEEKQWHFLENPGKIHILMASQGTKNILPTFGLIAPKKTSRTGSFHRMCKEHVCPRIAIHGDVFRLECGQWRF